MADSLAVTLQQCGESGLQREEMVCAGSLGDRVGMGSRLQTESLSGEMWLLVLGVGRQEPGSVSSSNQQRPSVHGAPIYVCVCVL